MGRGPGTQVKQQPKGDDVTQQTIHDLTEADVRGRAIDPPCPDCGAKAGVRCRLITRTHHGRTKVDVRPRPCDGRVTLAWRQLLREMA